MRESMPFGSFRDAVPTPAVRARAVIVAEHGES
jgi:hypothetical protein